MTATGPLLPLVLTDVSYLAGGKRIIDRVSLEIGAGPRTVLLGPNGSGKSVLVRLCRPSIRVWEFRPIIELILDEKGQAAGAVVKDLDTSQMHIIRAKSVIIATGGSGRLHYQGFPTTNHYGATGDGLVLAYRVGAKLAFIDTMQYHPTGAAFPEQILGQLVTEKVRGLGAQVCNADGEQFVYPLETMGCGGGGFHPRVQGAEARCRYIHRTGRSLA